jgi:hypothetical protein
MKRINIAFFLGLMLIGFSAAAEETSIQPQTQEGVTFVTGGVGVDEQQEMKALKSEYNLRLLFSEKGTGEYLSDVKVSIKDSKGNICLDAVSDGPMLFAKLKPGRYSVTVDNNGHIMDKHVNLEAAKSASLSFAWPQQQANR